MGLLTLNIAWYTDMMPDSDAQVAAHFSTKRPILGICLKRYSILPNGRAVRRGTYIDIPLEIALPHFIHDDNMNEDGAAFGNFKLSLQSVVCHRGEKVDSGHYVSLVRGEAPYDTGNGLNNRDQWMLFDDLRKEGRVRYVDVKETLKEESPYLLFYQVQPIDGDPGKIEQGDKPPTYRSSALDSLITIPPLPHISNTTMTTNASFQTARVSFEDPIITGSDSPISSASERKSGDWRRSVTFTDESFVAPTKPAISGSRAGSGNASLNVSRRPSQSGKQGSKSRPNSQSGESRLSASFTRAFGKLTKEKEKENEKEKEREKEKEKPEVTVASVEPRDEDDTNEGGKLRKEPKEKTRNRDKAQAYLRRGEKPERECIVM